MAKSILLLKRGVESLLSNMEGYDVDLTSLMTTLVENLHATSHMRHETFDCLDYARDFGRIMKESLKRVCLWSAKYFTHHGSYYPVPDTNMRLTDESVMSAVPCTATLSKEQEQVMREWLELYKPVRQRTVRGETTKDKCGTLPIVLYSNQTLHSHDTEFHMVVEKGTTQMKMHVKTLPMNMHLMNINMNIHLMNVKMNMHLMTLLQPLLMMKILLEMYMKQKVIQMLIMKMQYL